MSEHMTGRQLVRAARAARYPEADEDLLKRFRRASLIQRPKPVRTAGKPGSAEVYPPGTLAQLISALELHRTHRVLKRVRFELWWAGHWANTDRIRRDLVSLMDKAAAPARAHRDAHPDPFSAADAALDTYDPAAVRSPMLRAMRRLAGGDENLKSAIHALLVLVFGGEPIWEPLGGGPDAEDAEPSLAEIVNAAAGVTRAALDTIVADKTLLDATVSMPQALTWLRDHGMFDIDHPGAPLADATDEQLALARERAVAITHALAGFVSFVAARFGRDYAGLGVLHELADPDCALRAWITLLGLRIYEITRLEEHQDITDNLVGYEAERARGKCIADFLREHPGYRYIFSVDPVDQAVATAMTGEERQLLSDQIEKFLARRPECANTFSPPPE